MLVNNLTCLFFHHFISNFIRKLGHYNALFALRAFGFLITNRKITIPKIIFFPIPHPFLFLLFSASSISLSSILSPFRLHSVFLPVPFSSSLSHFATSIPHVLNCPSLLIAHSALSFLFFHPIPLFYLLVPTSKSRHHFSFFCSLSLQVLQNFPCHTPLILPFTQLYIRPSSFCSQYFHLFCPSGSTSLFPSSPPSFSFLSSIPSVFCTLLFYPFCLQIFPLSLSAYSSYTLLALNNRALLCPLLPFLSNIFLPLFLPLLVPSIPRSLPRTSISCSQTSSFSS
jgi:hypothetical protein